MILDRKGVKKLAQRIASCLKGGEVFILRGPLGSGKTFFVQAVAKSLGIRRGVKSPSFVLLQIYPGKSFSLAHFDFYRLSPEELADLEWQDYFFKPQYVSFVEWGEKVLSQLRSLGKKKFFEIKFEVVDEYRRRLNLSSNLKQWLKSCS